LNNKAHLGDLVPPEHTPRRTVVAAPCLSAHHPAAAIRPVVLKGATDESTGSGTNVRIAVSDRDIDLAVRELGGARQIVVEEYLPMAKNLCVQFAAQPSGEVHYLGTAEQICSNDGRYQGNWLTVDESQPNDVVRLGRHIMQRAVESGYRGIAGFDMARTADGRLLVFDLNFRFNGSTTPLLMHRVVADRWGASVMLKGGFQFHGPRKRLLDNLRTAAEEHWLLPLAVQIPHEAADPPRITACTLGQSRDAIRQQLQRAAELGFHA
jgi:hypothetical protein